MQTPKKIPQKAMLTRYLSSLVVEIFGENKDKARMRSISRCSAISIIKEIRDETLQHSNNILQNHTNTNICSKVSSSSSSIDADLTMAQL
jgi:hypothetical protein